MRSRRVLVIAEHSDQIVPHPGTLSAITFARQLCGLVGGTWSIVACTEKSIAIASGLRELGAQELYHCPLDTARRVLAEHVAPPLCALIREQEFDFVVAAATASGKDLLASIAGTLDAAYVGDCTGLKLVDNQYGEAGATEREDSPTGEGGGLRFLRKIYAGHVTVECATSSDVTVITTRSTEFERAAGGRTPCPVVTIRCAEPSPAATRVECLGFDGANSGRPALTEAFDNTVDQGCYFVVTEIGHCRCLPDTSSCRRCHEARSTSSLT